MADILIVEDDPAIAELIYMNLTAEGYRCTLAHDGLEGADHIEQGRFDLALLDIMLPEVDGYELLDYIRPLGTPVIFLTAKGAVEDRIRGLKAGADDYLTKPFQVGELLARVEAVLRRYHKTETLLTVFDVVIDTASRSVTQNGEPVPLTMKEFELLLLLARNRNIALYRETIYENIWGGEYMGQSRTVDLHIQRMRKKLGLEKRLVAVYKVGYRLEV